MRRRGERSREQLGVTTINLHQESQTKVKHEAEGGSFGVQGRGGAWRRREREWKEERKERREAGSRGGGGGGALRRLRREYEGDPANSLW